MQHSYYVLSMTFYEIDATIQWLYSARSACGNGRRRKESEGAGCSRKIGQHTRSMVSLFWLKFLIALFPYILSELSSVSLPQLVVTIEIEEGSRRKRMGHRRIKATTSSASKSFSSLVPSKTFTDNGDLKLGSSSKARFILKVKKTRGRRKERYCARKRILRGLSSSLLIRRQVSTIRDKLTD